MKKSTRGPILAIDTATRYVGLSLYDGESVLSEFTWRAEQTHTSTLMPNLIRMLGDQGLKVSGLGGLAVTLGPGSFTGLRIGLAVAKGLALAGGLPCVGVPTLDVVAYSCCAWFSCEQAGRAVRAYLVAGRGRFCVADYRQVDGKTHRVGDYQIVERSDVGTGCGGRETPGLLPLFGGELDGGAVQVLRSRLGDGILVAPPAARLRRAGYLAELGWRQLVRGEADDPATLSPIYLRTAAVHS